MNAPQLPEAVGLLLGSDLIFTSKITSTARALGQKVVVSGSPAAALARAREVRPRVVFVDLAAGEVASQPALDALRGELGPDVPFVAFGSHVDTEALAAAKAAGCDPVLPRSRFTAELPELIRRYLGSAESA